jgi:hypothetical protein
MPSRHHTQQDNRNDEMAASSSCSPVDISKNPMPLEFFLATYCSFVDGAETHLIDLSNSFCRFLERNEWLQVHFKFGSKHSSQRQIRGEVHRLARDAFPEQVACLQKKRLENHWSWFTFRGESDSGVLSSCV